ncbi:hypothetical protein GGR52DRAFT_579866 [Hypoxylon sp. FL1284]|nr:hypothetical protein GGR52DRAFT_579866 [Hypoxylon sp. FL1284]
MDYSAPKRRKTSPTSSVSVGGSSASPSSDGSAGQPTIRQAPSFASPTRASLARSNPDILERRNLSKPTPLIDAPAASEAGSPRGEERDATMEGKPASEQIRDSADMATQNAQLAQYSSTNQPRSPTRRAQGAMASKPRRTPNKPSPRPLPPPSAGEEELVNPFRGRMLRRSPPPGAPPQEEPELPPTPTQKGISDPASVHTSPVGIHNTPTKRPRRSRALAERIKSSPLKKPPLQPSEQVEGPIREESPSQTARQRLKAPPQSRKRKRKVYPARVVQEADPLAERRATRDALLAQVARLEADVELATRENDYIYRSRREKKSGSTQKAAENEDDLLDLLRRHALPPEKEPAPDPMQDWIEAAINPISFLPFGKTGGLPSSLFSPQQEEEEESAGQAPPSHQPVSMTMSEDLPYLQVFTPLTMTSTVSILPRDDTADAGPLMQKHTISISSTAPGLFAARIEMIVNTKSLSIAQLSVPCLEPSAVNELGPFVEMVIQDGGTSALRRNISVMTWAMSEWLRVAMRRALFWCTIERDLLSEEGLARCAREKRKYVRRKRVGRPNSVEEDDDDGGNGPGIQVEKTPFTKAEALPHLGRTFLDLELFSTDGPEETPSVRIQWRIKFDWTGEAQSKLDLLVGVPAKWHEHDDRGSLTSIPETFDKLVQADGDPMEALRTVVALLVGEN